MSAASHMAILAGALLLAASTAAVAAEEVAELRRNPFERPVIETAEVAPSEGGAKTVDNPGLRAVLVAGRHSVVNFGGVIMEIGDTVNGYKLVDVREGAAVFRNNGKKVVLTLYEQE